MAKVANHLCKRGLTKKLPAVGFMHATTCNCGWRIDWALDPETCYDISIYDDSESITGEQSKEQCLPPIMKTLTVSY